ncbi:MAG: J domain-containing protein [Acidimicrobiia bacterium]|nr:J domain-containing protein [Acidimicrobiia bacterium]
MSARPRPTPTDADVADAAALLGVTPGAPPAEIKRAWRAAVRVTHPDRVDGPPRRAAEHLAAVLNEARDVLLAVAGRPRGPVPFGAVDDVTPAPPTGTWEGAVAQKSPPAVQSPSPEPYRATTTAEIPTMADLPRPVAARTHTSASSGQAPVTADKAWPFRAAIGLVVLVALLSAAAVLVVYQLLGELFPH